MNFMDGPRIMRQKLVWYPTASDCAAFVCFRKRWVERFIAIAKSFGNPRNNDPGHNEQNYDPHCDP